MWKNYNKYKVLKVFFDDPLPKGGFQLREIGRLAKLAPKSVGIYLDELIKEELVLKEPHRLHKYPVYYANRDEASFKLYKKLDLVASLFETGLVDHLYDTFVPGCIILFGSAARGEDVSESDLDIFIEAEGKSVDLSKFEKKLGRKINPFFSSGFQKLSPELRNNIVNGIILKGYLKAY
jgi:predicted nucleotidyltransferase